MQNNLRVCVCVCVRMYVCVCVCVCVCVYTRESSLHIVHIHSMLPPPPTHTLQSLKRVRYSGLMPYIVFVASPRLDRLKATRHVSPDRPRKRLGSSASASYDMDPSQIYTVSSGTAGGYMWLCVSINQPHVTFEKNHASKR